MAELVKPWNDGGSLSVAYEGDGDGSAVFSSDVAEGLDREMIVVFRDGGRTVAVERKVLQVGMREMFVPNDGEFVPIEGGSFNVLKGEKPYTEIEYIESTGTQWIDTGYAINTSTDSVEFVFQNIGSTIYKWFMGEHDNGARFGLGTGDGTAKRNVAYGATTYKVSDAQIFNSAHTFIANENGVFLDGSKVTNFASFSSTSSIYLFNLNLNNTNYCGAAKVWSYKHYRDGSLIRDLIPVLDKDNIACMYDKVSGQFFYNKGTGNFIAGNKI
jgi:hypothetical protein